MNIIASKFPTIKPISWHRVALEDRVLTHKTVNSPILYSGRIERRGKKRVIVRFDDGRKAGRAYGDVFYVKEVMGLIDSGVPSMIVLEIEKEDK